MHLSCAVPAQSECHVLLDMLKFYVKHLEQYPNSLITRFYGCHSVQMYTSLMYFVVMENVFHTAGL
jgi:1-phosphatidylinositol-4-phosphate 5-kinase